MGTLVAWRYPTVLFAKLADHTYVTCGNGGARWKCWGGDTGGTALRQGQGSTKRADAIAEPDGKAGITCYLINGVCHQAANRILMPAGITVRGAKGYYVSESMFGTYGRPRGFLGACKAPFHQHPNVSGELAECEEGTGGLSDDESESVVAIESLEAESSDFQQYLGRVTAMYETAEMETLEVEAEQSQDFQLSLFSELVSFKLTSSFMDTKNASHALEIRGSVEQKRSPLEESLQAKEIAIEEFLEEHNRLTEEFQYDLANSLTADEYRSLLELEPGDVVILGDPDIMKEAYGSGGELTSAT